MGHGVVRSVSWGRGGQSRGVAEVRLNEVVEVSLMGLWRSVSWSRSGQTQ